MNDKKREARLKMMNAIQEAAKDLELGEMVGALEVTKYLLFKTLSELPEPENIVKINTEKQ